MQLSATDFKPFLEPEILKFKYQEHQNSMTIIRKSKIFIFKNIVTI